MGVMPNNIRQCRGKDRDGYLPSPFLGGEGKIRVVGRILFGNSGGKNTSLCHQSNQCLILK